MKKLEKITWLLEGGAIPLFLLLFGGFFLFYLRGQPLLSPRKMLRTMKKPQKGDGVSPFRAVMLALAGTLGVGNIVGVANAIFVGGAGAVFWMWASALFAMILKYAEILLAVGHRRKDPLGDPYGGAAYYIKDLCNGHGWKRLGGFLAIFFSCLLVLDALSMGCVIQVNAVSSAAKGIFGFSPFKCGLLLCGFTLPFLAKGSRGISALTEYLVPVMSGGYLVLSLAVLLIKREALPEAFTSIFREAFSAKSVGGGVLGFFTSRALRVGTMRGLLSNEGGCGTAPLAHAKAHTDSPAGQGVWGIFEVFVDTILLCTATALVILVSPAEIGTLGENGVMLTIRAYSSVLGTWSEWFFLAAVGLFGYATVLCWAGYGQEAVAFLSPRPIWKRLFSILFCICIVVGAKMAPSEVWHLSDFAIASLTSINLFALLLGRKEIRKETEIFLSESS